MYTALDLFAYILYPQLTRDSPDTDRSYCPIMTNIRGYTTIRIRRETSSS